MMLREYQNRAITDLRRSVKDGHRSPLYVLPTGGGKTAIAASMIKSNTEKGKYALFLAPRRQLIYQAAQRLQESEIPYGIIMAGERPRILPSVQVASVPTLHSRMKNTEDFLLPPASLVLVDEAHLGVGGRAQEIIKHYQDRGAVVVGLTATPARTDGRGLGMIYDDLVLGPSVSNLIQDGWLVPARYFSGTAPDTEGVRVHAGDFNQREIADRADRAELIGDVVSNWTRLAPSRQTFVFATSVAHSMHLAERFKDLGIAAEHIDGSASYIRRKEINEKLRDGSIQVLVNCEIMTYGVDYPPVSCIVIAKPTKSIPRYMQMVGRGLRTSDGKEDCMVLDHAGSIERLGFVDDPQPWSLDGRERIQDRKDRQNPEKPDIECGTCGAAFRAARVCPNCGAEQGKKFAKAIEAHEADLTEVDRKRRSSSARKWTPEEKVAFYSELLGHADNKGYKRGWAAWAYREKFGVWPDDRVVKPHAEPEEPGKETRAWIQHLNIKRAKRRQKENARAA